jgi:hypothetical protein
MTVGLLDGDELDGDCGDDDDDDVEVVVALLFIAANGGRAVLSPPSWSSFLAPL